MANVISIVKNLKGDRTVWLIVLLLAMMSVLAVYSSAGSMAFKMRNGNTEFYLVQQLMFIVTGFLLLYTSYRLEYSFYSKLAPYLILLTVPLLLYTMLFGTEINEARRWITIPWIDKTFQTSDFAKIALIIFVARSLATKQEYIKNLKEAFLPIIFPVIIVCGLIAPADLSTAALLFVTCLTMMFVGRISLRYVFMLILAGLVVGSIIVVVGKSFPEYVRVETWISRVNEFLTLTDGDDQVQQAKIAIASGEWIGVGPGNSIQRNHLPFAYADCIYAIICEEYGIVGGFTVLGLYLLLLIRCISIITKSPKAFGAILAMGLCLNIVIQAFANICVSVQLVPATGLTLPLISMGGTSLWATCISFGIILSVSRYAERAELEKKELVIMENKDINESDH